MLFDPDHACLESTIPLRLQYFSVQPAEDQEVFVVGGGSGWWTGWCSYPVCIKGEHGLEFPQDHGGSQGQEAVRVRGQRLCADTWQGSEISLPSISAAHIPQQQSAGRSNNKAGPSLKSRERSRE